MDRTHYADADYSRPTVPPATPPAIDSNADAEDATRAFDNGDSDEPGSRPAHFISGGDRDYPGEQPDEIVPGQGDTDVPERTPDEVSPDQGDFDRPGNAPSEVPAQPDTGPIETPPPPD